VKVCEDDVRDNLIQYLESIGIKDIHKEVPFFSKSIDVVYIDERRKFVCVEVKLTDYKTVFEQAGFLKRFINYVYVAMPIPATYYKRKRIEGEAKELGIGLYWLRDNRLWSQELEPRELMQNKELNKYFDFELGRTMFQ
jgi:hypothetical protein